MGFRNEAFSFFTHLGGALLASVGLVLLLRRAGTDAATWAAVAYGGTLVLMFVSSTLHHVAHREDGLFRRLDMTAIYLFIAGSYTPVCVLLLPSPIGPALAGGVWLLALVGVALRWLRPTTPRWVTAGLYLGLGWLSVAGIPALQRIAGWGAVALLAAGGLVYTVGAVVYARKRPDPWPAYVGHHGLWHVFVLVGAAFHFALVWTYVPW